MVPEQPRQISDFYELNSLLGDNFILFCGSAISAGEIDKRGAYVPFLPMVGTASEAFFVDVHNHLRNGDYFKKVLSEHALRLAKGRYKSRRLTRKFEDFIWRLEQVLGADPVVKLLYSLFYCEPGQFLYNHVAIANLLNTRRVKICFTTNFDNAIELASPAIAKLVHVQGFTINSIPDKPTVLKLHGDVVEGNYIATIPRLLAEEATQGFSYLEHLLRDKVILVAGYSGNGDIDIAPHLRKAKKMGARLVWLVRPGGLPSDIATDWFVTDLRSRDSNKNCLIKLGGAANKDPRTGFNPPWESRLGYWVTEVFSSISTSQIADMMDLISGWAKFQLYFISKWDSIRAGKSPNKDKDLLNFAKTCLEIGTYYSALSAIRKINRENIRELKLYNELLFVKGFSDWRLVQLTEASNTLRYFSYLEGDDQLGEVEKGALRVYIEVLREIISSYVSASDAYNFYYAHQVGNSCAKLLAALKKSYDPGNTMLSSLVVLDIETRIGKRSNIDDYRLLYQRAVDLQLWTLARAVARSILRINMMEGVDKLRFVHSNAGETWRWHSIKHNTLAVLDKLPKLIINPAHIANIILSRIPVLVREVMFGLKRVLWRAAYESSMVITE